MYYYYYYGYSYNMKGWASMCLSAFLCKCAAFPSFEAGVGHLAAACGFPADHPCDSHWPLVPTGPQLPNQKSGDTLKLFLLIIPRGDVFFFVPNVLKRWWHAWHCKMWSHGQTPCLRGRRCFLFYLHWYTNIRDRIDISAIVTVLFTATVIKSGCLW